jgi:hypothetical protein
MKILKKSLLAASVAGLLAVPFSSANAWWGGGPGGYGNEWGPLVAVVAMATVVATATATVTRTATVAGVARTAATAVIRVMAATAAMAARGAVATRATAGTVRLQPLRHRPAAPSKSAVHPGGPAHGGVVARLDFFIPEFPVLTP